LIVLFKEFFEVTETEQDSPRGKFRPVGWQSTRNPAPGSLFDADRLACKNSCAADETIEWRLPSTHKVKSMRTARVPHPCPAVLGRDRVGILIFSGV
jgi:hypothetical protein